MKHPDPRDYLDGEYTTPEQWERWQEAIKAWQEFQALQEQADEERHLERLVEDGGEYFAERTE